MSALLALWLVGASPSYAQDASADATAEAALERAYQKEYAYLTAEREALERRLSEQGLEADRLLREAEGRVDRLQGRLIGLSRSADEAELQLDAAQRGSDAAAEGAELVAATLTQAGDAVGIELEPDDPGALRDAFTAAAAAIRAGGEIRVEDGSWFLADGAQVDGQIVRVGRVASYGHSERGGGALLPVGEGRLQLRPEGGEAEAAALASGQSPASLGLFLYESVEKRVTEREDRTVSETLQAGGVVAWVIAGLGGAVMLLAALRLLFLTLAGRGLTRQAEAASAAIRAGQLEQARTACDAKTPMGRVLARILEAPTSEREGLQDAAGEALLGELPAIDRFGVAIMVVAAVAPLLGLLGTVTGMIATFEIITEFGTGDPGMLSEGISEALITTQLGLVVAIPAVLLGNLLNTRAESLTGALERGALQLVNHMAGQRDG